MTIKGIHKPDIDKRNYKVVQVGKIPILLVSDPETKNDAISISFEAGSMHSETVGLPHFLEHMFFQEGKRPDEDQDFQTYIASTNGKTNAFTDKERTVYMCSFESSHFEKTIVRFISIFHDPEFDEKASMKEKKAVDNEYVKDRMIDGWREFQVYQDLIADCSTGKSHPFTIFGCGTKDTLKSTTVEDLKGFFNSCYKENPVRAVVYSQKGLAEIEGSLDVFKDVASTETRQRFPGNAFAPLIGKFISIKPLKSDHTIKFNFLLDSLLYSPQSGDLEPLAMLIDHKKNLMKDLFEKGLALDVDSGLSSNYSFGAVFTVGIALTDHGQRELPSVAGALFAFLGKLRAVYRDQKLKDYIDYAARVLRLRFKYSEKGDVFDTVSDLVQSLNRNAECPENVLANTLELDQEQAAASMLAAFEKLVPDNCFVSYADPELDENGCCEESWFRAKYKPEEMAIRLQGWETLSNGNPEIAVIDDTLPKDEGMVPDHEGVELEMSKPNLAELYTIKETRFKVPRVCFRLQLLLPKESHPDGFSPAELLTRKVFCKMVDLGARMESADWELTGNSFAVGVNQFGFSIDISCYSEKLESLVQLANKYLKQLMVPDISAFGRKGENWFYEFRKREKECIENNLVCQPYEQNMKTFARLIDRSARTESELLEALEEVTPEYLRALYAQWSRNTPKFALKAVLAGNVNAHSREIVIKALGDYFSPDRLIGPEETCVEGDYLLPGTITVGEMTTVDGEVNSALMRVFRVGYYNSVLAPILSLFFDTVNDPLFQSLRTQQQLGYIVSSAVTCSKGILYWKIIVQSSDKTPGHLQKCADDFLTQFVGKLSTRTDEIETHIANTISQLREPKKSLSEVFERGWDEVSSGRKCFEIEKEKIAVLEKLQKKGLEYVEALAGSLGDSTVLKVYGVTDEAISEFDQLSLKPAVETNVLRVTKEALLVPQGRVGEKGLQLARAPRPEDIYAMPRVEGVPAG